MIFGKKDEDKKDDASATFLPVVTQIHRDAPQNLLVSKDTSRKEAKDKKEREREKIKEAEKQKEKEKKEREREREKEKEREKKQREQREKDKKLKTSSSRDSHASRHTSSSHRPSSSKPPQPTSSFSNSNINHSRPSSSRSKDPYSGKFPQVSELRRDKEDDGFDMKTASLLPTLQKSVFTNPTDLKMASRQAKIASLAPVEQKKQEEWAQSTLRSIGPCPAGFTWNRVEFGYRCSGGTHYITHEVLAEGKPAAFIQWHGAVVHGPCQLIPDDGDWWLGPFYIPQPRNGMGNANRGRLGGFQNLAALSGLGYPMPDERDLLLLSHDEKTQFRTFKEAGITFPKGKVNKPGYNQGNRLFQPLFLPVGPRLW